MPGVLAPKFKACHDLHGIKLCRPLAACLTRIVGTTAFQTPCSFGLWASWLTRIPQLPSMSSWLQIRLSLVNLDPDFHVPHPVSAGSVPFPMSCVGRWRGLAALSMFPNQNIPILIKFWGLKCCSNLECNKILTTWNFLQYSSQIYFSKSNYIFGEERRIWFLSYIEIQKNIS